jgi:hypothetical protein
VAIAALGLRVLALERVSGLGMIELLLPALPKDQIKIPPLVLYMAEFALPVLLVGMEALSRLYPLSQERVTGQALFA